MVIFSVLLFCYEVALCFRLPGSAVRLNRRSVSPLPWPIRHAPCRASALGAEMAVAHLDRHVSVSEPLQGSPGVEDAAHLRSFRAEYGDKARAGPLLHTGDAVEWLLPDVLAVPWWRVI